MSELEMPVEACVEHSRDSLPSRPGQKTGETLGQPRSARSERRVRTEAAQTSPGKSRQPTATIAPVCAGRYRLTALTRCDIIRHPSHRKLKPPGAGTRLATISSYPRARRAEWR